jgi:hypothetical protein
MAKTVRLEKSTLTFRDDGIVEMRYLDEVEVDLAEVKKQIQLIRQECTPPVYIMTIPSLHGSVSREVKNYARSPEVRGLSEATAIVVANLAQRIMANFMMQFLKRNIKLFNSEEAALEWLKEEQERA